MRVISIYESACVRVLLSVIADVNYKFNSCTQTHTHSSIVNILVFYKVRN